MTPAVHPADRASVDPAALVRPRRRIDWEGFVARVARTTAVGITAAVDMDTGDVQRIDDATRRPASDRGIIRELLVRSEGALAAE